MSVVAGNGIFWPYAVIWASSQARKETISFLKKLRKFIFTCTLKDDSTPAFPKRLQAIKEWKENERKLRIPKETVPKDIQSTSEMSTRQSTDSTESDSPDNEQNDNKAKY